MNPALETMVHAIHEHPVAVGDVFFLGAEPHPALPRLTGWQPLKPLADLCISAGMGLVDEPLGRYSVVLFLPGKSKEEILSGFGRAYGLLAPGGVLIVSLANTAGASRFEKLLCRATALRFSVSKNKCRAFAVSNVEPWKAELLEEWEDLGNFSEIAGTDFVTVPGVFSARRVDPGSELLASHLPAFLRGDIADLGGGWGFLSRAAMVRAPGISRIDLFEADQRALSCARRNVSGNIAFHWHDVTKGIFGKYDHVIMNPPFHTAQTKDLDLGKAFLTVGAGALKRGGTLHLVVNRQLPYEAHLESLGMRSRLVAEDHAYKVIFAS